VHGRAAVTPCEVSATTTPVVHCAGVLDVAGSGNVRSEMNGISPAFVIGGESCGNGGEICCFGGVSGGRYWAPSATLFEPGVGEG